MIKRNRILAGTAIGLLMTATSLGASPLSNPLSAGGVLDSIPNKPLILVQNAEEEQRLPPGQGEQPAEEPAAQQPPAEQEAPAEPQAAPEPQPEPQQEAAPEPEPAQEEAQPAPEAAPEPEPAPEAGEAEGQAEPEPSAEESSAAPEPAQEQAEPAEPEQQQAEPEAPAEPEAAEEAPAQDQAPAEEQAAPEEPAEEPAAEEAQPSEDTAPADEPTRAEGEDAGEPAAGEGAAEEGAAEEGAAEGQAERPRRPADADAPDGRAAGEQEPAPESAPDAAEQAPEEGEQPAREGEAAEGEALPENAAPVLDSQKEQEQPAAGEAREGRDRDRDGAERGERRQERQQSREEGGPPPDSDRTAQERIQVEEIRPVTAEEGRRIEDGERRRPERWEGARVVEEIGDRAVIQFNNTTIVQSQDRERVRWRSNDYYYEELPRGRTREVVVRDNGVQVITIRNRYGDIIRRSRIAPDGREYVLVYAGEREDWNEWHDPAADLPPMQLTIPASEYILEAEPDVGPDDYYTFLDQPPVEPVQRLYTVDEVKYSARIRDTVRRVDLDTINFEFGSDQIAESEIETLEDVAVAMERLIEENPGETFLIEGHTDAVGSDTANLALSDRRAESVAEALTNVFGIPPENMFTQGYGEQYLKIDTEEPERENRRVAIRRITPLVQPVASAE